MSRISWSYYLAEFVERDSFTSIVGRCESCGRVRRLTKLEFAPDERQHPAPRYVCKGGCS